MGNKHLHLVESKRELKRQHFLPFYQENTQEPCFADEVSYGYRVNFVKMEERKNIDVQQLKSFTILTENNKSPQPKISKISVSDPSTYPYSCVGLLLIHFQDNIIQGTGSLIGKNMILTTASNIYHRQSQQFATKIQFILNIHQNKGNVYEIGTPVYFNEKFIDQSQGSHRYDYALLMVHSSCHSEEENKIQLEIGVEDIRSSPGLTHGYLGINSTFNGKEPVYFYGYSSEVNQRNEPQHHLRHQKLNVIVTRNASLGYKMQSYPSQTGSPLLIKTNDCYQLIGIHINSKKKLSCGLQFDSQIIQDINSWIQQIEGNIDLSEKQLSSFEINKFIELPWHNMAVLNLNNNHLTCQGVTRLTKQSWPMLRELYLCQNCIYKLQIDTLAIINLKKLFISNNHIRDISLIGQLNLLRVLNLSNNRIETVDQLCSLTKMQRLDLSTNKIQKIPVQMGKLQFLKKLYLSRNQLESLPVELLQLEQLTALTIDGNRFKNAPSELILKLQAYNVEVIAS